MRKSLILAGTLAALLTACNPPMRGVSVPCNCHGTVATANPEAETPRFVPPGGSVQHAYRGPSRHVRYHHATSHGYSGTDDDYARDWNYARVAMSAYSYRSESRAYRMSSYAPSYAGSETTADTSGGYNEGASAYENEGGWQDGYGRYHRGTRLSRGEYRARMDPWHGYDVDCYRGRHHHHHRHY